MNVDLAIAHTVDAIKKRRAGDYGYDVYPSHVARMVAANWNHQSIDDPLAREWSPYFFDAAWELCKRGILRPGVYRMGNQPSDDGGYSLTAAARETVNDLDSSDLLLLQPGSLSVTLGSYQQRYGEGFQQRSQEAIKCRSAGAWLACCSMAGAAAESVLLALAIAKSKDERKVLSTYHSGGGRRKIVNMIVGQADEPLRRALVEYTGIISTWRDEAAHGKLSMLTTANADEALRQLLHMCQSVDRDWDRLVS